MSCQGVYRTFFCEFLTHTYVRKRVIKSSFTHNQPQRVDHRKKLGGLGGSLAGSFNGRLRLKSLDAQIVHRTLLYREFQTLNKSF